MQAVGWAVQRCIWQEGCSYTLGCASSPPLLCCILLSLPADACVMSLLRPAVLPHRCTLCRQEVPVLLTALLALRRVAIHHPHLLADSLEDVIQVLLECVHGANTSVSQAAVMALGDLMMSFGNAMLRHLEHGSFSGSSGNGNGRERLPQYSCLLGLLVAASRGRTPAIRVWANEVLR